MTLEGYASPDYHCLRYISSFLPATSDHILSVNAIMEEQAAKKKTKSPAAVLNHMQPASKMT